MKMATISAIRSEGGSLRTRSGSLRDHSRELRQRARENRLRFNRVAGSVATAAKWVAEIAKTDSAEHVDRLARAERELVSAIAECSAALAEVRREIGWQDTAAPIVH